MRIAIGSDHAGFPRKEHLRRLLAGLGPTVQDMGTCNVEPVDYPDYARAVALGVLRGPPRTRAWSTIT